MKARDVAPHPVTRHRERDAERDHSVGSEARIHGAQFLEAAKHETGADEQHRRHCHLRANEELSETHACSSIRRRAVAAAKHR